MSRDPTPKYDRLRELREANFERAQAASRAERAAAVPKLREKIAAVPARKSKAAKKKRRA